jgi:hypothetical protein
MTVRVSGFLPYIRAFPLRINPGKSIKLLGNGNPAQIAGQLVGQLTNL